jgi:hypothetical protein
LDDLSASHSAVDRLRRRMSRDTKWVFFFLFLIVGGCVVPWGIAYYLAKTAPPAETRPRETGFTATQGFAIAGFALPVVGLAGVLLMLGDRSKYTRALGIAEQSLVLKAHFSEKPPDEEMSVLKAMRRFDDADYHVGSNCICGQSAGKQFAILDHSAGYKGQVLKVFEQTVVIVYDIGNTVPEFQAAPCGFLDRVGSFLGDRTVEIPGAERFNKEFTIYGADAQAIQNRFSPKLTKLLLKTRANCEVRNGTLIYYMIKRKIAPGQWPEFVQEALDCAAALAG